MRRFTAVACAIPALAALFLLLPSERPAQGRTPAKSDKGDQAPAFLQGKKAVPERPAQPRAARPSKDFLTARNMADLHRLIRPQKGEYKWDAIPWYASSWHARRAASAEDKPIFVFGTGGAGFNDPLGNC
jgi:hypothetical protein